MSSLFNNFRSIVISHRFFRQEACALNGDENTLELLKHSIELGSKACEFDIWLSNNSDQEKDFYLIHGPYLEDTTTSVGFLPNIEPGFLDQAKTKNGFKIPKLKEVLELIPDTFQLVNIELKGFCGHQELSEFLLRNKNISCLDKTLVSSFDHRLLSLFKQISSEVPIALLTASIDSELIARAKRTKASAIVFEDSIVEKEFVREVINSGLEVLVYTVNNSLRLKELFAMGVKGVISDRADLTN